MIGDGGTKDERQQRYRISASYDTPFFVEAVTLKLGLGNFTQTSDLAAKSGTSSGLEAEWSTTF